MARKTRIYTSLTFEIGDAEYEVSVTDYTPGELPSRDSPGDASEISLSNIVRIQRHTREGRLFYPPSSPGFTDCTTWDVFIMDYAIERGMPLDAAEEHVFSAALEHVEQEIADAYDMEPPEVDDAWFDRPDYD